MKTKDEVLTMTKKQLIAEFAEIRHQTEDILCIGGTYCTSCLRCTDCTDCIECTDCTGCTGCTDCDSCFRCTDCTSCIGCTYCTDCIDSYLCCREKNLKWAICNVQVGEVAYRKRIREVERKKEPDHA